MLHSALTVIMYSCDLTVTAVVLQLLHCEVFPVQRHASIVQAVEGGLSFLTEALYAEIADLCQITLHNALVSKLFSTAEHELRILFVYLEITTVCVTGNVGQFCAAELANVHYC